MERICPVSCNTMWCVHGISLTMKIVVLRRQKRTGHIHISYSQTAGYAQSNSTYIKWHTNIGLETSIKHIIQVNPEYQYLLKQKRKTHKNIKTSPTRLPRDLHFSLTFQRTIKLILMESRIEMNAIVYKTSQLLIIFAFFFIIIIIHRIITFPRLLVHQLYNNNDNPLPTSDLLSFHFSSFGRIFVMLPVFLAVCLS